jgi:hypothetical protein
MTDPLGFLRQLRRSGHESFHRDGDGLGFSLLDFWQWSGSDLVGNTARGVLAEYIVAKAVGITTAGVREGWAAYDLETDEGIKIEVKSAGFVQSWTQSKLSTIQFGVPKRRGWNPETSIMEDVPKRHADIYVFALLVHREKSTIDPLNLTQWRFYVLPARVLDERTRSQHSITLRTLESLAGPPLDFWQLGARVRGDGGG